MRFLFIFFLISSKLLSQSDTIVLLDGGKIPVEIHQVSSLNIEFNYKGENHLNSISSSKVSYVIYNTGEKVFVTKGFIKDIRDGKNYQWVKIGEQYWLAENMNYFVPNKSWCYDSLELNCLKYGRLYNIEGAKKACPLGWHLPSINEWDILADYISDVNGPYEKESNINYNIGAHLKSKSGWKNNGNGLDNHAFNAIPAGGLSKENGYIFQGTDAYWWTSTPADKNKYYGKFIVSAYSMLFTGSNNNDFAFSVRCVKD